MVIYVEELLERIIDNEGGYVNSKNDPGGETKYGISKSAHPNVDIKNLTIDEAKEIYEREYLKHIFYKSIHPAIVWQILDYGVNSGMYIAIKSAQRIVGVESDGVVGPKTIAAFNEFHPSVIVIDILSQRLKMLRSLPGWKYFGNGWSKRIYKCLAQATSDVDERWG